MEAPGLSDTAGKGWAEGPGLFGAVRGDGAPEPWATPMHTLIYTCSIHMYLPSAHTPHTNMHIHAHTNALRCTLMRAHRRTRTHMHICMGTHVHTHWDVSFPPPWRLRGLQGNRSHVPTGEKDALPTGAPDSPLNPSPPGGPGARLLPGAQEGCPPAAFSLEKPAPTGGFHPPP